MMNRVAAVVGAAGVVLAGAVLFAQQPLPKPSSEGEIAGVHSPSTAEDHRALADDFTRKAEEHRKEAGLHRRMLAAYERLVKDLTPQPAPPRRRGLNLPLGKRAKPSKDPVAEYRSHCETYIRAAEMLAAAADDLAEFHAARARELREMQDP